MTGKELIIYILVNHLEDEELFKDGKISFLMSEDEIAEHYNVGTATVRAWCNMGFIHGIEIENKVYVLRFPSDL